MLLLKMVFKFTGCCTGLFLNFLYLFRELLMFICILLPLLMSVNIRLMHKFSGMWCRVTGQAVPSVCHAFTVQSKMNNVDPLTLMTKALDVWNLRTAHPMTMSHPKGHLQPQCWDTSDLCEFHFKFLFFWFSSVILEYNESHCMTQENYIQLINW